MGLAEGIQLLIACASLAAVVAAVWAATAAKRASEAGLFSSIIAQYSSPEMLEALQSLGRWRRSGDPTFSPGWRSGDSGSFHQNVRGWAKVALSGQPSEPTVRLDQHRRRVTYFFALAALLIEEGQLSAGFAEGFRSLLGKELYLDVVLPMELAIREHRGACADDGGMKQLEQIHRIFFPGRILPVLPPTQ